MNKNLIWLLVAAFLVAVLPLTPSRRAGTQDRLAWRPFSGRSG